MTLTYPSTTLNDTCGLLVNINTQTKHRAGGAQRFGIWSKSDKTIPPKQIVLQRKERWKRDDGERKRESKCVRRKKAKRLQKSNSLTSVWGAVVASEGQRRKINMSWFAEGGRVGGGEKRRAREMGKKTDSRDLKTKTEKSSVNETKSSYTWFYTLASIWARVLRWQVRLVFLGLPGGRAREGGLTCRGEQTGREQPVNAVRKQTRAVLHRHAERTLGRTTRPRTAQKKQTTGV